VLRGRRIEDEVEATRILLEGTFLFRGDEVISTESQSIIPGYSSTALRAGPGIEAILENLYRGLVQMQKV
jgi:hypothetical protein